MLNPEVILLFIISFLDLALGLFVLLKNPKDRINRSFALFTLSGLVWIVASFFEDELRNTALRYFLLKLDFASGVLAAFMLLLFCLAVSKSEILGKRHFKYWIVSIPIIFTALIFFTNLILAGYSIIERVITPIYGSGAVIYDIFVGTAMLLGVGTLLWKYGKSSAEDKAKFIYLFIGFFLTSAIAFATNIWLADFIKASPHYELYSRLGLFSSIFVILFSGYAIVKHRLLDLKILAAELLSLGILVFSLFQLLLSTSRAELLANGIVFVILLSFTVMLVRSVENESDRKDQLQLMSDSLARANDKLRKLDNTKSDFISIASHQLRTPLTSCKGYLSLLLENSYGALAGKQKEVIKKLYANGERMAQLVEDFLNVTKIESGRMEYTIEKWRVEDICREVVDTLMPKAKDRNLFLDFKEPSERLPEVEIDGAKVREVISNLVDNALKYTPKGGVSVNIGQQAAKADDTGSIRVTVSDTGIGIPKTELPYLFAKFSRGKDTSRLNAGGTGLGLYVGKSMIEANGGKIWAESDGDGRGSRFIVELPVVRSGEIKERDTWGGSGARSTG